MTQLAELGCPETSARFAAAVLMARKDSPVDPSNPVMQSLPCGHDAKHGYRYGGKTHCRKCKKVRRYEAHRCEYLPDAIENAKRKLETLEREARARGVLK